MNLSSRLRLVLAGGVGLLLVGALAFALTSGGVSTTTISARFATAPGLFVGNQVKILGMRVGSVSSVTPGPTYVTVEMVVPSSTKIPSDAQAFIMAPNWPALPAKGGVSGRRRFALIDRSASGPLNRFRV